MLEVLCVDKDNYHLFRSLFLPGHIQKFQNLEQHFWGLGMILDNKPIGISLMELHHHPNRVSIFNFTVKSDESQLTMTELLLHETEKLLSEKGYNRYVLDFHADSLGDEESNLFLQNGWSGPLQQISTYLVDTQLLLKEPWMSRLRKIELMEILPWIDVPENKRAKLATGVNDWFPIKYSPFRDPEYIEKETSFALSYQGEIIGWILCEKVASNMILARTLFVRNMGKARIGVMLLLAEVIKNATSRKYYSMFVVDKDNLDMNNIVSKRIKPGVIKEKTTVQFEKQVITVN